jgi:PIN domain nuclease of toxin-antitoxin system
MDTSDFLLCLSIALWISEEENKTDERTTKICTKKNNRHILSTTVK